MHHLSKVSRRPRQTGFTLIELIVVLVILGILAAFAIPRFAGVNADARVAAMQGLAGSLRSSAALVHGLALARNQTGPTGSVPLEGTPAVTLVNGYPTATAAGIGATILNLQGYTPDYTTTPGTAIFAPANYTTTTCVVTYAEATGAVAQAGVMVANCG